MMAPDASARQYTVTQLQSTAETIHMK